jgi:hypothetical protein
MATKKKVEKKPAALTLGKRTPKQVANSTSFKAGNPHAFQPGDARINRTGKSPLDTQLLSRNLKVLLNDRCPTAICERLSIPRTSSWSQALAAYLVRQALTSESWSQAFELILRFTEPKSAVMAEEIEQMASDVRHRLVFVEADGDGAVSERSLATMRQLETQDAAQPEFSEEAMRGGVIEAHNELGPEV